MQMLMQVPLLIKKERRNDPETVEACQQRENSLSMGSRLS